MLNFDRYAKVAILQPLGLQTLSLISILNRYKRLTNTKNLSGNDMISNHTNNDTSNNASSDTVASVTTPLFATEYHIYINHTDAGGIVYHANHLVFFENARRDWFTKIGLNGYFLQADNGQVQHFVVSQAELNYRKAILLDEIIETRIDKVELKPASIIFYQSIHRKAKDADSAAAVKPTDTLLSSARIVIACVQNQVQPETSNSSHESEKIVDAPATMTNVAPIRPIRVPSKLHAMITQAIVSHANE